MVWHHFLSVVRISPSGSAIDSLSMLHFVAADNMVACRILGPLGCPFALASVRFSNASEQMSRSRSMNMVAGAGWGPGVGTDAGCRSRSRSEFKA